MPMQNGMSIHLVLFNMKYAYYFAYLNKLLVWTFKGMGTAEIEVFSWPSSLILNRKYVNIASIAILYTKYP